MRARALLGVLVAVAACTGNEDPNVCQQAAEHVAECQGSEAAAIGDVCEGDGELLAQQALHTSCDAMIASGKADAWSSGGGMLACIGLGAPVFAHGLEAGSLCCFDHNCEGALVCRKFKCVQQSALGGSCDRVDHCQDGLACKAGKCATPVVQGGSCDTTAACADDLVCDAKKKCNPPAADGATCTREEQCRSFVCAGGRCVTPSDLGGACGSAGHICARDYVCVSGACAEPPSSNKPCDRKDFFACPDNETCWEDHCVRQHGEGEACLNLFDCKLGFFCRAGSCQP